MINRMKTILIIDDIEANINTLMSLLDDKYDILASLDGEGGLDILADEENVDLILLDILMPEMDGFEVIERLRANPTTSKIPIIVLSVLADDERLKMLSLEACISKPYRGAELLKTVHEVIARLNGGTRNGS